MRVLDVGCGAGDVSMLAGKLVGASGSVVGIDLNADILAVARERSQVDGFTNVTFLRGAARLVKRGGVLALHEPILDRMIYSRPNVALWQQTADWILATFRARTPSWDAAGRMIEHFSGAGLAQPKLFSEVPIGGGIDAPHYAWFAGVARTFLPQMIQTGVATAETIAIETLESRLRSAVVETRSQVEGPAHVCAWTSV
jgi:SAM-dependent methyltransferase